MLVYSSRVVRQIPRSASLLGRLVTLPAQPQIVSPIRATLPCYLDGSLPASPLAVDIHFAWHWLPPAIAELQTCSIQSKSYSQVPPTPIERCRLHFLPRQPSRHVHGRSSSSPPIRFPLRLFVRCSCPLRAYGDSAAGGDLVKEEIRCAVLRTFFRPRFDSRLETSGCAAVFFLRIHGDPKKSSLP